MEENKSLSGEKICVTSQGNTLDGEVDPRFGRCQYFIIVDIDTLDDYQKLVFELSP